MPDKIAALRFCIIYRRKRIPGAHSGDADALVRGYKSAIISLRCKPGSVSRGRGRPRPRAVWHKPVENTMQYGNGASRVVKVIVKVAVKVFINVGYANQFMTIYDHTA